MGRLSQWEREEDRVVRPARAAPATAVQTGALAWASAVGNQAVQRAARTAVAREEIPEDVPEDTAVAEEFEEAAPEGEEPDPAVADVAPEEAAGLAALDDLPEGGLAE